MDESRAVLSQPFVDAGFDIAELALAALAEAADGYPFFLQLYGEAAWNAMQQREAGALSEECALVAIKDVEPRRRQYFRDRYRELHKAGALPFVRDVALAFREAGGEMTEEQLNALLAKHDEPPAEKRSLLNARGFIWQDDDDHWISGIPSLMDYMIEATGP